MNIALLRGKKGTIIFKLLYTAFGLALLFLLFYYSNKIENGFSSGGFSFINMCNSWVFMKKQYLFQYLF